MFLENQLLPISALQHLLFCERQCALIHVEQLWAENQWTVEGRQLHEKAHQEKSSLQGSVRISNSLQLRSLRLGLVGQADVVEFHSSSKVVPVEYKRGKPKTNQCDEVQLCAQALCLEEMLNLEIDHGFLFYGKRKRRTLVQFDSKIRDITRQTTTRLHQMIDNRETPLAVRMEKCDQCSLLQLCLPDAMRYSKGINAFVERQIKSIDSNDGPKTDDFEFVE